MRFDFLPRATLTLGYCETKDILDDTEVEFTCFGTLVAIKFYHLHIFTRRFDHAGSRMVLPVGRTGTFDLCRTAACSWGKLMSRDGPRS